MTDDKDLNKLDKPGAEIAAVDSTSAATGSQAKTSGKTAVNKAAAKKSSNEKKSDTAAPSAAANGSAAQKSPVSNPTPKSNTASVSGGKPAGRRSWFGIMALILVLVLLAAGGYGYWQLYTEQQQAIAQLSVQQDQLSRVQGQLKETQTDLQVESDARASLDKQQQALASQFETLNTRLGRTTFAWRLAELEYLLTLANHRLEFLRDISTAISMLVAADQRLAQLGDPGLLPVREAMANELTALRALDTVDVSGIVLQLGSIANEVAQLPMVDQQRIEVSAAETAVETEATTWRDIPRLVWENLKSLVQIRRHSQPVEALLPAKESWYLTQNLRLKLEQAQLAALRLDTALFRQSLQEADAWLAAYYDQEATAVKTARDTLAILQQAELKPELPDISTSLRRLREFAERQELSSQ